MDKQTPMWKVKKEMCQIGQRIWQRGYCAGNEGNHSVRIGDDRILCTPTGISKGFLTPDDICVTDMDGRQVEVNPKGRKRTSEVLMHVAIYQHRPDVGGVVHSHPPHATAFAIANIPIPEGIHPEAEIFLGRVPMARFAVPSTQALPQSIINVTTTETNTVLMGNHGTVSFAETLIDTYSKLEILDNYCRILLLCHQLGKADLLSRQNMTGLMEVKKQFGMTDSRLSCAPRGCVGEQNEPFFATFDVRPTTATCACNGGNVMINQNKDQSFDSLVVAITDQIKEIV